MQQSASCSFRIRYQSPSTPVIALYIVISRAPSGHLAHITSYERSTCVISIFSGVRKSNESGITPTKPNEPHQIWQTCTSQRETTFREYRLRSAQWGKNGGSDDSRVASFLQILRHQDWDGRGLQRRAAGYVHVLHRYHNTSSMTV